jgi:RNA polymerase sigma-70 factor (ECF subfamily)
MNDAIDRFERLFEAHEPAVRAYCARRLDHGSVDDAVAETFAIAWNKLARVPEGAELPWLYGVARRVVQHVWRSDGRRDRLAARTVSIFEPPRDEVADGFESDDDRRTVLEAASRLSEDDQEILRLTLWEELSPTDAAITLSISPDAAKQRAARARRRLAVEFRVLSSEPTPTPVRRTET